MNIYSFIMQIYSFILILKKKFKKYFYFCTVNDFYIIIFKFDEKENKTY